MMGADIKLVATDMDGTFLYSYDKAHPDNIAAVQRCREQGILFCANTGRYFANVHGMIRDFGMDNLGVFNNGASVADINTGEIEYIRQIPKEIIEPAVKFGAERGAHISICGHDGMYFFASADVEFKLEEIPSRNYGFMTVVEDIDEFIELGTPTAQKIFMNVDIHEHAEAVRQLRRFTGGAEITSSYAGHMEITAIGVNKATGLKQLAKSYGIEPEQIIAFGDNLNDMEMLQWAGTGVAMGNAQPQLKEVADVIAPPCKDGGLAAVLEQLVFSKA